MTKKIVIASNNQNKIKEFNEMLEPLGFSLLSLKDLGFSCDIVESGSSFEENSYIKAKTIFDIYNLPTIADDSGLEIDALNNKPGIYSHRYSGKDATDLSNRRKVISELKELNLKSSKAHFSCAITYIDKDNTFSVKGELYGDVILEEKGHNGFGYDPIFYLKDKDKTVAELSDDEKNKISHRHNALVLLLEELKKCA